jgi:hypothetical protein
MTEGRPSDVEAAGCQYYILKEAIRIVNDTGSITNGQLAGLMCPVMSEVGGQTVYCRLAGEFLGNMDPQVAFHLR